MRIAEYFNQNATVFWYLRSNGYLSKTNFLWLNFDERHKISLLDMGAITFDHDSCQWTSPLIPLFISTHFEQWNSQNFPAPPLLPSGKIDFHTLLQSVPHLIDTNVITADVNSNGVPTEVSFQIEFYRVLKAILKNYYLPSMETPVWINQTRCRADIFLREVRNGYPVVLEFKVNCMDLQEAVNQIADYGSELVAAHGYVINATTVEPSDTGSTLIPKRRSQLGYKADSFVADDESMEDNTDVPLTFVYIVYQPDWTTISHIIVADVTGEESDLSSSSSS